MKKVLPHILIALFILTVTAVVASPTAAFASGTSNFVDNLINITLAPFIKIAVWVGYLALSLSSKLLYLSGILLNSAINESLHISTLVNNTPMIGIVWRTIRDFSSIFFIFLLLYASITTILGVGGRSPKQLIISIVICALLINFSLFFTKLVIDASNMVAIGFYDAMTQTSDSTAQNLDGGISNVFVQSLRSVSIFDAQGVREASRTDFEKKMIPALVFGTAIMLITAGSFVVVTLMLLVRLAILIILMAFSPIYFLSIAIPGLDEFASKWRSLLIGQALVAPAYLAIIYVVMKIVSSKGFTQMMFANQTNPTFSQALVDGGAPGVLMNFAIVTILLNMAVAAALKLGTMGGDYSGALIKKTKKLGTDFLSSANKHTFSRAASLAASSDKFKDLASKSAIVAGAYKGMKGVAQSYDKASAESAEKKVKFAESLGYNKQNVAEHELEIKRLRERIAVENATINNPANANNPALIDAAKATKKRLEGEIKDREDAISREKRARQDTYATGLDPRKVDQQTGNLKPATLMQRLKRATVNQRGATIGSDQEKASAQIRIKNNEAEIERIKKRLEDKKKDRDTHKADIKRLDQKEKDQQGGLSQEQDRARNDLRKKLFDTENEIQPLEKDIRDIEFENNRLKNLT